MINLQYISDSNGETTGVFIPISEWNELKAKYKVREEESIEIPDWQKKEVRERLTAYKKNSGKAIDFDSAIDDIEKSL